jgi:hypothetical protein
MCVALSTPPRSKLQALRDRLDAEHEAWVATRDDRVACPLNHHYGDMKEAARRYEYALEKASEAVIQRDFLDNVRNRTPAEMLALLDAEKAAAKRLQEVEATSYHERSYRDLIDAEIAADFTCKKVRYALMFYQAPQISVTSHRTVRSPGQWKADKRRAAADSFARMYD